MENSQKNIQIGDWNNIQVTRNCMNVDVGKLIRDNKRLTKQLEWAMQQLAIKDILLKKFCDEYE